jgi:hypothetical protein
MKRRVFSILMLVVAIGALIVPTATAESSENDRHTLTAEGDGMAFLFGRGSIELSGNGILWVKAEEGAIVEVSGYGQKEVFPDGWQQYAGFHGDAFIQGRRLRVMVAGVDVHLGATGRGKAFLWGHGTHQQGEQVGSWGTGGLGTSVTLSEATAQ